MIQISYSDLLDILHEFRVDRWEHKPCSVEAFAKYTWNQYDEIPFPEDIEKDIDWGNPITP